MEYREEIPLREQLQKWFGFQTFKGSQKRLFVIFCKGKNTFVLMPGRGSKSPLLPAAGHNTARRQCLLSRPSSLLMKNQVGSHAGYSSLRRVSRIFLNSSLNRKQIAQVKDDVMIGRTKMLYVAPESLMKRNNVGSFAAYHLFTPSRRGCASPREWGHDFRPEYRHIREMVDKIGTRPSSRSPPPPLRCKKVHP